MENNLNVEIVERDPKSFAFHPSNPRDHSDESVARLAESIQEDSLYFRGRPILLSDRTGELVVIGGEGRTRAAILLGLDSVPSVVFHGLTEEDEMRIMQKDNSHSGKWDNEKLTKIAKQWGANKVQKWLANEEWRISHNFTEIDEEAVNKLFEKSTNEGKTKPQYIIIELPIGEEINDYFESIKEFCSQWPFVKVR